MHLKLDSSGSIDDGDVARDLGRLTADIVVLSAADSDLAAFGAAHARLPGDFPSVRLTNLLALGHPHRSISMSSARCAMPGLSVLRMLGGESYWPHGVESLRRDALRRGALLACIPGELSWDAGLAARGTLNARDTHRVVALLHRRRRGECATALRFAAI